METHSPVNSTLSESPLHTQAPNPWRPIAIILGMLFLGTTGLATYFWQQGSEPLSTANILSTPTPTVSNKPISESICPERFFFSDTGAFSVCVPDRFAMDSYSIDEYAGVVAIFKSASSEQTLSIVEHFVGGWGANPCATAEPVAFLGQPSQQYWSVETLSQYDMENPDKNPPLVCGKTLEGFITTPENKWSITLNAHELGKDTTKTGVDRAEFAQIRDSFTVKTLAK